MEDLLDNGKWSDLTIKCQNRTWNVHRALVLSRSKPLEAMMTDGFKEAKTGVIDLEDDEPLIVDKMLRFIYQKDYDDEREPVVQKNEPETFQTRNDLDGWGLAIAPIDPFYQEESLLINVKVYILADKLDIIELKELATSKYEMLVLALWDTAAFLESVALLFGNTMENDLPLREIIAMISSYRIKNLMEKESFVMLMKEHGDLAVMILEFQLGIKIVDDRVKTTKDEKKRKKISNRRLTLID